MLRRALARLLGLEVVAKEHPEVKGSVHAWIAIIGGVVEILVGAFTTFMLIISLLESM